MNRKSFIDIYKRNVKGLFWGGLKIPDIYPIGLLVPLAHLALLPLTVTVVAVGKSSIDYFSRKEIPEASLSDAKSKIQNLDMDSTTFLIKEICKYKLGAKSKSSRQLIHSLEQITLDTQTTITAKNQEKKRELQEEQLKTNKDPNPSNVFQSQYISDLPLNEDNQQSLNSYMKENEELRKSEQLTKVKTMIVDYLSAPHNTGKRLQHLIFTSTNGATINTNKNNKTTLIA